MRALAARVERTELEARELEAKVRLFEAKATLDRFRKAKKSKP